MMNPFNSLIYTLLFISTMFAVSSTNWLFMWMMLELNLLAFIPMMMSSSTLQETEASVKYFLIQALGSSLLLMSSLMLMFNSFPMLISYTVLTLSLSLKMGLAPLHMWYPSVMSSITWTNCFLLSTWQKLTPLLYMAMIMSQNSKYMFMLLATISTLLGGLLGMNQSKLRSIMAYSSITHLGWMMALMMYKPMISIIYFVLYTMIIMPLFMLFNLTNLFSMSNNSLTMNNNYKMQMMVPLLLLSLSGIPPLTGFMPKWMTMMLLAETNPILLLLLIVGSLMSTYYYLSLMFTSLMNFIMIMKSVPSMLSHYPKFIMILMSTSLLMLIPFTVML